MLKSTIGIIVLSAFFGLFAGIHVPNIRMHQAIREFCSRKGGDIDTKTLHSAFQVLLSQRKTSFVSDTLESLDAASDNCLEYFWFPVPNSIKTATNAQLYVISTFDKNYQLGRDYVFHKFDQRHYREARELAQVTMTLRGTGEFHNTFREAYFADCLISLQLYSDAEKVLNGLLPVEMTILERDHPALYRNYRQALLGQALLGQRKYHEAANVLKQSAEDEASIKSLTYYRGIAFLGMGRDRAALQAFNRHKNNCQNLFIELCSREKLDQKRKDKIMNLTVKNCDQTIGARDDVPSLEMAGIALKAKGFDEAADEVAKDIHILCQN